ncbi:hypothetical protein ECZU24_58120 [Escherichia coli]|nr:hypothetical protein ECZU24_58120 [Escherichia coli]
MNAIIPHKRRDGRSSFEDLIAYTSVRDDVQENELTEDSEIKSDVLTATVSDGLLIMQHACVTKNLSP